MPAIHAACKSPDAVRSCQFVQSGQVFRCRFFDKTPGGQIGAGFSQRSIQFAFAHFDGLLGFGKIPKQAGDVGDVPVGQFLALAAQAFAHLLPEAAGVNQLDPTLAVFRLLVGKNPDVGADARVVEHVGGQPDDGFHQVVFQDVTADFRFAAAGTAGEHASH